MRGDHCGKLIISELQKQGTLLSLLFYRTEVQGSYKICTLTELELEPTSSSNTLSSPHVPLPHWQSTNNARVECDP